MSKKSNTFNSVTRKFSLRLPLAVDAALDEMMTSTGKTKATLVIEAIQLMFAVDRRLADKA